MPFLFQRKIGTKNEVMSDTTVVNMQKGHRVELAEQHPGLHATSFTPHDFHRLLATELVNSGLPNGLVSRSISTSAKSSWEDTHAPIRHLASMSTPA